MAVEFRNERPEHDLDAVLAAIQQEYPPLRQHRFSVRRGIKPPHGGLLEFYPEWEAYNPNPGTHTIEVFEPGLRGRVLHEFVAGDALHLLGAVDPRTGAPVDPIFRSLKDEFASTYAPRTQALERAFYERRVQQGHEARPFEEYMDHSRIDAYIRAGVFPMSNPDWLKPGVFTPEQQRVLERMREYLTTGRAPFDPLFRSPWLDRTTEAVAAGNDLAYGEARGEVMAGPDVASGARAVLRGLEGPSIVPSGVRVLPRAMSDATTMDEIFTRGDVDFQGAPSHDRPYETMTRPYEGEDESIVPRTL